MIPPSKFPKQKKPASIFTRLGKEVKAREAQTGSKIFGLHVGDTFMDIPAPMITPHPGEDELYGTMLNRYGDTAGDEPLRRLLLEKVQTKNKLPVDDLDSILVTGGATGGLQAAFSNLIDPGETLMVISPYWTILRHVVGQSKLQLLEVPLFDKLQDDDDFNIFELLEEYGDPWCRGIYLNTPSNPTGMVLGKKHLEQIAEFAKKRDLWIFSDEAYEDFIYDDKEHVSIGSLPDMLDRTISVYTFSKNFGTSGLRIGYIAGSPAVITQLNSGVVGNYYHTGRFDQRMAWRGMLNFEECYKPIYDAYRKNWELARDTIKTKVMPVSGSFYFFVWLGDDWKGQTTDQKVKRMLEAGIVLAPGESFGSDFDGWARMCFTIVDESELQESVSRLNKMLGK